MPAGASLSRFSLGLAEHAAERHRRIRASIPERPSTSTMPPGFRAEDVLGTRSGGFLPLAEAAEAMVLTEHDVVDQVVAGLLEARLHGSLLYVQPAIVSVLAVRRGNE